MVKEYKITPVFDSAKYETYRKQDTRHYWYNFDTESFDFTDLPAEDDQVLKYIPTWPGAREMYQLLREHYNYSILDAMRYVLSLMVGEPVEKVEEK